MKTILLTGGPRILRGVLMTTLSLAVAACGGGGGSDGSSSTDGSGSGPIVGTYTEFADTTSTEATALSYLAVTNAGAASTGSAGTLDHDMDEIDGPGELAGTFTGGRTGIDLSGGGTAVLSNEAGTEFLRIFSTSGTGSDLFGVVGQATTGADMPDSGSANYDGTVLLDVSDGAAIYALTGDVAISATFAGTVDSTFSGFSGTRTDSGGTTSVSGLGTVSISGATQSGTGFSGGTPSGSGSVFSRVTDSADITGTNGQFFGPNADEVGGTLVVEDTSISVFGVYAAE